MSLDLSPEALLRASGRAADLFTEIYAGLEDRRVDPGVTREEMLELFEGSIGEDGVGLDAALEEFARKVLPHSMGTPHPLYLGLVNSSPLPAGPLADLLVSALNNNGGAFHQSPAISATEQVVIVEFARLCGLDDDASGMILPGGTFANLQGLLLARRAHFPAWHKKGPTALSGRPLIYRSEVAHFCVDRAASVLGIGEEGMVSIPVRGRGAIDLDRLEQCIVADRKAGRLPFAVVANGGTTGTGALDDIGAVAEICRRRELWLHVDACYGGGALLLRPGLRELDGLPRADSVAIDPHKWFFVPMTAGLLLTPHRELELDAFDVATSYIPGDGEIDPFRRGLPTSRRSSGLTIWLTLRAHGWQIIREAVERNIRLTRLLEDLLRDSGFRVLEDGRLSIACARWEPPGATTTALDDLQAAIARAVVETGRAWFSTVRHEGVLWLRLNLVNIHTREHHIRDLAGLIARTANGIRGDAGCDA
jgi:aromatic-L-amino-acid decarboxylase